MKLLLNVLLRAKLENDWTNSAVFLCFKNISWQENRKLHIIDSTKIIIFYQDVL